MMTLYPYFKKQVWVFDDEQQNLKEEAFVLGMSEIISATIAKKRIQNAKKGFKLDFSNEAFPGHDVQLTWMKPGILQGSYPILVDGKVKLVKYSIPGDWYHTGDSLKTKLEGWLCPALLKYFDKPPQKLYCAANPLPKNINPIWTKPAADAAAFVTVNHIS